jgi:hypothetical protein
MNIAASFGGFCFAAPRLVAFWPKADMRVALANVRVRG